MLKMNISIRSAGLRLCLPTILLLVISATSEAQSIESAIRHPACIALGSTTRAKNLMAFSPNQWTILSESENPFLVFLRNADQLNDEVISMKVNFSIRTAITNTGSAHVSDEITRKPQLPWFSLDLKKQQARIDLLTEDSKLKELEIQRQKIISHATAITGFLILLLAIGLYNRYRYVRKTKRIIEDEMARSEKLLLNILPFETAKELKEKGYALPKSFEKVSILFTDFVGFTRIAEKLTPEKLVSELNKYFYEFDKIIDRNGLEKIKTIGDGYMCAGGIPLDNLHHAFDAVKAGLEINKYAEELNFQRLRNGEDCWELRIGIHTGKVIAGIIGKNKFAYDIWGDTVNIASCMESAGIPGKVNISGETYELIKDKFNCTYRGKIMSKNKDAMDMFIVEGYAQEPSAIQYHTDQH